MNQVRIVLADDHEVVRTGLKALLDQQPDLHVVGEASSGEEAIEQATLLKPDLVVMDIRMPGISGIDACRTITTQLPETRVIMLTTYAEDDLLSAANKAGASSYVLKRIGMNDLIRTIREIAGGEIGLDPDFTATLFKQERQQDRDPSDKAFSALTGQELRVLALIKDGSTNREIAERLFLSEGTVRNYVSNLLSKLNLANRAEAAAYAVTHNIDDQMTFE